MPPIHPGELLPDELNEIGVSLNELSRALRVPMNRISAIVNGKRSITVDTALRLARYFGTSPQYWLNLFPKPKGSSLHLLRLTMASQMLGGGVPLPVVSQRL